MIFHIVVTVAVCTQLCCSQGCSSVCSTLHLVWSIYCISFAFQIEESNGTSATTVTRGTTELTGAGAVWKNFCYHCNKGNHGAYRCWEMSSFMDGNSHYFVVVEDNDKNVWARWNLCSSIVYDCTVTPQVVPHHNCSSRSIYSKLCCCRWFFWTNYGCHGWSALPQVVPSRKPAHGGDKSLLATPFNNNTMHWHLLQWWVAKEWSGQRLSMMLS